MYIYIYIYMIYIIYIIYIYIYICVTCVIHMYVSGRSFCRCLIGSPDAGVTLLFRPHGFECQLFKV